jgi:feruloyl esterase
MPGMEHCRGGVGPDQADFLGAMEPWLEADSPPERITSARIRDGRVDMTQPLCPYPQVRRWTGEGSADDAANYQCVAECQFT